jgi:SAM-dependent methyltransferase
MPQSPESLINPFQDWGPWSETPLGRRLIQEEQAWLDGSLQDVFGYNAVQIGPLPLDALRANRMSCRARMVWPKSGQCPPAEDNDDAGTISAVAGSAHDLPFLTESLDLLVLPHTLEIAHDAHHLLREAQRVLIPEGRIVITGFNPISPWALRKTSRSVTRFPPSGHAWISLPRLKDWLRLLNFDLGAGGASAFGAYVPPFESERWLNRMQWMDPAGRRWWPMAGGVYFLMAVKRVHHMQLIGPSWRDRKAVTGAKAATASSVRLHRSDSSEQGATSNECRGG